MKLKAGKKKAMNNIAVFLLMLGALCTAVWAWASSSLREAFTKDKLKDAEKDKDIANEPSKRGADLLDGLQSDD